MLLLVVNQHPLSPLDALSEAFPERGVTFALLNVPCDRRADYVRDRLTVDGRYRIKLLRLVGREADGHRFEWFHAEDCATGAQGLSSGKHS